MDQSNQNAEIDDTGCERCAPSQQARVTTVRVPQDLYDDLTAVARADGEPVSVAIRRAIAHHLAQRKADPEFRARAAAVIARDQARLAALSTSPE
jgi:predicted transcriptional regulator